LIILLLINIGLLYLNGLNMKKINHNLFISQLAEPIFSLETEIDYCTKGGLCEKLYPSKWEGLFFESYTANKESKCFQSNEGSTACIVQPKF